MKKEQRMQSTAYYEYVNVNPKNKFCGDCVIRAIAHTLNQSWEQTIRELTELGIKKGLVCNDTNLYPKYLESKGFVQCKEPRDCCNRKMSIKDWIDEEQITRGRFVVNVGSHHVTAVIDGKVHDIWNCSYNTMHKYWYKK